MKILQVCIGNPYSEEMYYKENYFTDAFLEDGNEVVILADTTMWENGKLVKVPPCDKITEKGIREIRVEFSGRKDSLVSRKLRKVKDFSKLVCSISPDIILFQNIYQHGVCELEKIKKALPKCRVFGDSSATYDNSAKNFLSKHILHKTIYKRWVKRSLPYWDKIFYVTDEAHDFLSEMYEIPEELLEFNPLPGKIMPKEEKLARREKWRTEKGIKQGELVLFHSGKMDVYKHTVELLDIVAGLSDKLKIRLFLGGSFYDDIKEEAERRIATMPCVTYLGFLSQEEMRDALAACDIYLQPGSASQTAQAAIACGTPIVVSGEKAYRRFINGNGYLIKDDLELIDILLSVYNNLGMLDEMSEAAYMIAGKLIDYKKLASRLYESCDAKEATTPKEYKFRRLNHET